MAGVDDDGDGLIDEDRLGREPGDPGYGMFVIGEGVTAIPEDDDEDGIENEDPPNVVIYRRDASMGVYEDIDGVKRLLALGVHSLKANHRLTVDGVPLLDVYLEVGSSAGETRWFSTTIYPVNNDELMGELSD